MPATRRTSPAHDRTGAATDRRPHRLAKRDGSVELATLRPEGDDPRLLVGWIAHLCGLSDDVRPTRPRDWVGRFDPEALLRTPWVVSLDLKQA